MSLCVLLCALKNGTSWRKWLCLFCCCLFLGGFRVVQVIRKDFTWCSLTVYQVESNQQLRTDQSQVNQQVSHWLKSLTVFLVCVTEDKMRQDFLFYHLFIELILVVFVLMYFYMCLCVTAWTKKSEESESSVSYQPHDFLLYSCTHESVQENQEALSTEVSTILQLFEWLNFGNKPSQRSLRKLTTWRMERNKKTVYSLFILLLLLLVCKSEECPSLPKS